jgi:hypothetical protein
LIGRRFPAANAPADLYLPGMIAFNRHSRSTSKGAAMKLAEVIPSFDGTAIHIPGHVIARWQKVYRNIQYWPAALKAADEYCASCPQKELRLSKSSLWLGRLNAELGAP